MLILSFLTILLFAVIAILGILPEQLIQILMPVIVWLAVGFVNWLKATLGAGGFGGTVLVTLVVPLLSLLLTWVTGLIVPGMDFWGTFFLGLIGVYINEVIKQWNQSVTGVQKSAKKDLVG
jgi:hypothetical protein